MSLGRLSSLLVALPLANAASSATFISSDLTSKPSLENIKATWDTDLEVAGNKAEDKPCISSGYTVTAKELEQLE